MASHGRSGGDILVGTASPAANAAAVGHIGVHALFGLKAATCIALCNPVTATCAVLGGVAYLALTRKG